MNIKVAQEILKARPKTLIVIAVLLLVTICLYMFIVLYQRPRLETLQGKWFEMRKFATGGAVPGYATAYQQGEHDLKVWRERILLKKNFARFVGTLFETAASNSLLFKSVSYKISQAKDENLTVYSLDFTVIGRYAAVKSFLADLGRLREIVTVDNISLSNSTETGESVGLKVLMTVYLRMEEQ